MSASRLRQSSGGLTQHWPVEALAETGRLRQCFGGLAENWPLEASAEAGEIRVAGRRPHLSSVRCPPVRFDSFHTATLRFDFFLRHPLLAWLDSFCTNGFGSVRFAQMGLVHFVLHK